MGVETEVPKLLMQMYLTNVFTRGTFLEKILTMPSISNPTDTEKDNADKNKEIQTMLGENGRVGEATRRILLSYYYIYDKEMLDKILGSKAVLFQQEYKEIDPKTGKRKKKD